MLDNIKIKGFRTLKDIDIPLRNLNVLIGPNGCGKTAFLDVFQLLREAAIGKMQDAISEWGGMSALLCRKESKYIEIECSINQKNSPGWGYLLKMEPKGLGHEISRELLFQRRAKKSTKQINYIDRSREKVSTNSNNKNIASTIHDWNETALAQLSDYLFQEKDTIRTRFAGTAYFAGMDVSPRSPSRLPQQLVPVKLPGRNGEGLISALHNVSQEDPPAYQYLLQTLEAAFDDFDRLSFPTAGAGHIAITWYEKYFKEPFYQSQISEGTLRFIYLATILLSPYLPPITLIDEPEVSLHPDLIRYLAVLLKDAALRTQLIVATHSDRLIRWLKPENVLVVDKEEGESSFRWADTLNLEEWLDEYTLDQLWLMGEIGGRS